MWFYFTDPVLRAPTIGCMLMCLAAALVGVIVVLGKQSLLGECLSHAAYPGVIVGVLVVAPLVTAHNEGVIVSIAVMVGAFSAAWLGLLTIQLLQQRLSIRPDAALCFVLSAFFGVGLTMASRVQFTHTTLYLQMQAYLYGQPATMTDVHIAIYAILSIVVLVTIILFYKELQVITFDRDYAESLGINVRRVDGILFFLVVTAVVVGIRSVGVVLMSAMLIAPAAAARQYTNRLSVMLVISAVFAVFSGFFGNYLSVELPKSILYWNPSWRVALPTGPMVVLVATAICIFSLLLAPERGIGWRCWRAVQFRYRCLCENVLKTIWRLGPDTAVAVKDIHKLQTMSSGYLRIILGRLAANGWLKWTGVGSVVLTADGRQWAAKIVRLHRLWELYLTDYVGIGVERVHRSAEEMEHIITPEIEDELTVLLQNPKQDPHHQPIPPRDTGQPK